jgi:hypothetical protein
MAANTIDYLDVSLVGSSTPGLITGNNASQYRYLMRTKPNTGSGIVLTPEDLNQNIAGATFDSASLAKVFGNFALQSDAGYYPFEIMESTNPDNNFTIRGIEDLDAWVSGVRVRNGANKEYISQSVYINDSGSPWTPDALTNPGGARTDSVYLDVWLEEVDSTEPESTNAKLTVYNVTSGSTFGSDIPVTKMVVIKWRVIVEEGRDDVQPETPLTDHYYWRIATLTRSSSDFITSDMITNWFQVEAGVNAVKSPFSVRHTALSPIRNTGDNTYIASIDTTFIDGMFNGGVDGFCYNEFVFNLSDIDGALITKSGGDYNGYYSFTPNDVLPYSLSLTENYLTGYFMDLGSYGYYRILGNDSGTQPTIYLDFAGVVSTDVTATVYVDCDKYEYSIVPYDGTVSPAVYYYDEAIRGTLPKLSTDLYPTQKFTAILPLGRKYRCFVRAVKTFEVEDLATEFGKALPLLYKGGENDRAETRSRSVYTITKGSSFKEESATFYTSFRYSGNSTKIPTYMSALFDAFDALVELGDSTYLTLNSSTFGSVEVNISTSMLSLANREYISGYEILWCESTSTPDPTDVSEKRIVVPNLPAYFVPFDNARYPYGTEIRVVVRPLIAGEVVGWVQNTITPEDVGMFRTIVYQNGAEFITASTAISDVAVVIPPYKTLKYTHYAKKDTSTSDKQMEFTLYTVTGTLVEQLLVAPSDVTTSYVKYDQVLYTNDSGTELLLEFTFDIANLSTPSGELYSKLLVLYTE